MSLKRIYLMIQAVRLEIAAITGVTDGNKGDITVSSSGTVWRVTKNEVSPFLLMGG